MLPRQRRLESTPDPNGTVPLTAYGIAWGPLDPFGNQIRSLRPRRQSISCILLSLIASWMVAAHFLAGAFALDVASTCT